MRVYVVTKPNMQEHACRTAVLELLRANGSIDIVECESARDIKADADRILVFGGDGTVLEAVRALKGKDVPVLGVNLGNMGFLTAFEQNANSEDIVDTLINGKCVSRMLLDVFADDVGNATALNEVVIKTHASRPITLDLSVDGMFVDSIHSDGIIISSPTGSTAYSLSAGGPVLAPDMDALVINPICAHSLHSRPLVVSASSHVCVKLTGDSGATITLDGRECGCLKSNGAVRISKSLFEAKFIYGDGENFYAKLLQKMNRWGITLR